MVFEQFWEAAWKDMLCVKRLSKSHASTMWHHHINYNLPLYATLFIQ